MEQDEEKPQSFWIFTTDWKFKHFLLGIVILLLLMAVSAYLFSTWVSNFVLLFWCLLFLSVIPVGMLLIRFLIWERWRLRTFRKFMVFWAIAIMLLIPTVYAGHKIAEYRIGKVQLACEPVIKALDIYYEKHGSYPEILSELGRLEDNKSATLPEHCSYRTYEDNSWYSLYLEGNRFIELWRYTSRERKWIEE